MAYQALYRQWRPANFSQMVGQEAIVLTLRNQIISGRIAHAYLFCGSRGTGKTSTAKIMAKAINCLEPIGGDPCGKCEVCIQLEEETTLDVIEIDAASNNGVDEIRDLREHVKYPPQYGKYKVYIIDEVHMLTPAAFNALLKTLEEPPSHTVFILATTEPQKLPATILSRCQRFDFGRIPAMQIAGRLEEAAQKAGVSASEQSLMLIARAAEGGMRDALSILDMCMGRGEDITESTVHEVLGTSDKGFLFAFGEALRNADPGEVLNLINDLMRNGREPQVFARDVSQHVRALLMALSCGEKIQDLLEITKEDAAQYITQAQAFSEERLLRILDLFMAVETQMRYASSPRVALESAALKACLRSPDETPEGVSQRVAELEKQIDELSEKLASGAFVAKQAAGVSEKEGGKEHKKEGAEKDDKKEAGAGKTSDKAESKKQNSNAGGASGASASGMTPTQVWAATMKDLRRTEAGLFGQLNEGKFVNLRGDTYRIGFSKENTFICNYLNKDARKEIIGKVLTHVSGGPAQFEAFIMDGGPDPMETDRRTATEQSLIDMFGREAVQIEDE